MIGYYTFKCQQCGGRKDQKVRRVVKYITCVCGGQADRISDLLEEPNPDRLWWDGNPPPNRPAIVLN